MKAPARLADELARLARSCGKEGSTLGDLKAGMSARDHALLTLALSICVCHPFPLLGLAIPIGLVMTVAGARMSLGLGPWVPERWARLKLPAKTLERVFSTAARAAAKIEPVLPKGRLNASFARAFERINGGAIALCGVLLALPLPPPTNFPPALAAGLLSLAVLMESGVWLGLGYFALALNLVFFGAIAFFGLEGLKALLA